MKNLDLFLACIKNPEPYSDSAYHHNPLVISTDPQATPTPHMTYNNELIQRLSACALALKDGESEVFQSHVSKIQILLNRPHMNLTEFASFWPTLDFTFSIYKSLSAEEKTNLLIQALHVYLKDRHTIYSAH
jgi:hypothetical protein